MKIVTKGCTLHIVHCILYTILYIVHCTTYIAHWTFHQFSLSQNNFEAAESAVMYYKFKNSDWYEELHVWDNYKQDRQRIYNVTLRRVRATTVAVENSKCYILWVCVCSLSHWACNVHAPYCHLWPAPLYSIFQHFLINCTIFGNILLNIKCVFWFSLQTGLKHFSF